MNDNFYKYGVIWNYFGDILCENYQNDSLIKYEYIIEDGIIRISYGSGSGKIKYFKDGQLTKIEKNGWFSLPVIVVNITPGSKYNLIVKISDPKGEIREIHSNSDSIIDIGNPYCLYPFYKIDDLCKYFDWSHYDLQFENNELKKKIIELEESINKLENRFE